jgi:hypothetical protein
MPLGDVSNHRSPGTSTRRPKALDIVRRRRAAPSTSPPQAAVGDACFGESLSPCPSTTSSLMSLDLSGVSPAGGGTGAQPSPSGVIERADALVVSARAQLEAKNAELARMARRLGAAQKRERSAQRKLQRLQPAAPATASGGGEVGAAAQLQRLRQEVEDERAMHRVQLADLNMRLGRRDADLEACRRRL